jgi:c-di-GMP-binding flagellar brake protein YcgR
MRVRFLSEDAMGGGYDGEERRRDPRFSLRVPIYIAAGEGVISKTIHLGSRDISAGGVSFETASELPLEAESQIIFSGVGEVSSTYIIRGRVVWKKPLPDTGRNMFGVQFTGFEGVSREELLSRMEEWAKSRGGA